MNHKETDLAELDRARDIHIAALNAGDPDAWAGCFAASAVQMPPDQPPNAGSDQILNWSRGFLAPFSAEFSLVPARIELAEPACAIEHGTYEITLVPCEGGEPVRDTGKYLTIYRRNDDGGWLMAYDIWDSNGPIPA
jgi:uncharacterized protein (TIGR02246 family)